jgi:hypothetical protein
VKLLALLYGAVLLDGTPCGFVRMLPLSVRMNSKIKTLQNCTASYPGEGLIKVLLSLELKNFGGTTPHATIQNNDFF